MARIAFIGAGSTTVAELQLDEMVGLLAMPPLSRAPGRPGAPVSG